MFKSRKKGNLAKGYSEEKENYILRSRRSFDLKRRERREKREEKEANFSVMKNILSVNEEKGNKC